MTPAPDPGEGAPEDPDLTPAVPPSTGPGEEFSPPTLDPGPELTPEPEPVVVEPEPEPEFTPGPTPEPEPEPVVVAPQPEPEPEPEPVVVPEPIDADGDGYPLETDCDDTNSAITTPSNWYPDVDNDTYGDSRVAPTVQCSAPAHHVANNLDCEDAMHWVNPHEPELCDSLDNNCNGQVNEGFDNDNDNVTTCAGDCNDTNASINPAADELCDGIDNNCNAQIDESPATGETTYYLDNDGDGYGEDSSMVTACNPPDPSWVVNNGDCDDSNVNMNPGETEVCNDGFDNDCDGGVYCLEGEISLADADIRLVGTTAAKNLGTSLSSAGDINNDGYGDVIMGAPIPPDSRFPTPGRVFILLGGPNLSDNFFANNLMSVTAAGVQIYGAQNGDRAGLAVFGAGDLNNDGIDDALVGAPFHTNPTFTGGVQGVTYILYGSSTLSPAINLVSTPRIYGAITSSHSGSAFAVVNIDNDAFDDLFIGAPQGRGRVYLLSGGPNASSSEIPFSGITDLSTYTAKMDGESSWDIAGTRLASAGHANWNDLHEDVAMSAPYHESNGPGAGSVYIYLHNGSSPPSGDLNLADADFHFFGETSGSRAGSALAAGDIDGNSRKDLLIGAPFFSSSITNRGKVYLHKDNYYNISGEQNVAASDIKFLGQEQNLYAGSALAFVDVNNDGYDDVLIGAYGHNSNRGIVYLFYGPLLNGTYSLDNADAKFLGQNTTDRAGYTVSAAGDVNGDGYQDIAIGAPYKDSEAASPATDVGMVYIIYGGGL